MTQQQAGPRVTARYDYVNEDGSLLFQVERLVPKGFRQRKPDGNGGWTYSLGNTRRVLYRLPEVVAARNAGKTIYVVEGEKDADSLAERQKTATTCPLGAEKWRDEYTEVLRGARVIIVADRDESGYRHVLQIACALDHVVAKQPNGEPALWLLQPREPHKDVSDHLKAGLDLKGLEHFDRAAAQARLVPKNAKRRSGVISARDFCRRPGLNGELQLLGPALNRTMRLTIGALSGDGKTTLGLQMVSAVVRGEPFLKDEWRGKGGRALVVDVEQGEETVKQRFREVGLDNDPNVDLIWEPDGLALDREREDRRYVEKAISEGDYDVVLLDPLYQLHAGNENEERTAADVMRVLDGWARRYELAIIIPMHRRKPHPQAGINSFSMNDIGGHGAWVRNSEIVLGLQVVHSGMSRLRFFKDRPGYLPGVGTTWDLAFDGKTRSFRYVEADEKAGWQRAKEVLSVLDEPPTTAELASMLGRTVGTTRGYLQRISAHVDDPTLPLLERRWSLEPFPERQPSMFAGTAI